ncbi:MAG: hypothetical protein EXQ69_05460 [Acidimicrobiia bacterium]|nr:hypothetical protein [Acidimicrobiia bacterium]
MASPVSVHLIPDPDQHDLLVTTLERVNKACNAARIRAIDGKISNKAELRTLVKEELERFKLPAAFNVPSADRVTQSLKGQKFGAFQALVFAPAALKWSASDRVVMPTAAGKRTVRVYSDPAMGNLRPPLEGKFAALVYRNGEFELVEADVS